MRLKLHTQRKSYFTIYLISLTRVFEVRLSDSIYILHYAKCFNDFVIISVDYRAVGLKTGQGMGILSIILFQFP